jgi:ribosome maturation factor RimP
MVEDAVKACDLELYDTYFGRAQHGRILHVKIDSKTGVSAEDCAKTAKQIRYHLSAHETDHDNLQIEVSSPGIERPLKQLKHYLLAIEKMISVSFIDVDKKNQQLTGQLKSATAENITIKIDDDCTTVPYQSITNAHIVFQNLGAQNE